MNTAVRMHSEAFFNISSFRQTVSAYREFSKSGIVTLVLISVLGGYLLGQPFEEPLDSGRMALTLIGVLCLASGSSALNQLQEQAIDALMPRTAKRPLPSGRINPAQAWAFIGGMLAAGLTLLARLDPAVAALGAAAVIFYNGLYTLWWKKHWAYAAVPGAIPGALPVLMGSTAASGKVLLPAGVYLFFLLFYWQMPHFWVLALRFRDDYEKGHFPTLPVAKGEGLTIFQISLWCLGYVGLALMAPLFLPRTGIIYFSITLPLCAWVLWELRRFVKDPQSKAWLRFFLGINFSLILFIGAAVIDLWHMNLLGPFWVK